MSLLGFQYAEALFSLANETQKANEMAPLFEDISSQIEQDVRVYLSHPNVPKANKKTVVNKLTDNTLFRHFLFVLVDNNRLDALEDIKAEYKKILDHQNKHLDVVVYSKNALSDEEIDRLKKTLKQKKGRDITLKNV
ncbi:MAG: ATP synthase F1 subunit delta, partial [Candidatus Izimaplasma sp.]|nr:ATP synthase F1 subunit delta [Candidatus Izimaplasma bacterium]